MNEEVNQIDVPGGVQPQPETQPEPEQTEVETQETETEQKGAGQRIKELSQRARSAEEQVKSLSDRINELTQTEDTKPFVSSVKPGEEISPERYQQDVTQAADSIVKLRMKQYEAETRIKSESVQAITDYPQLNPNAREFDPDLSDTITEAVEAHVRMNPYNASVKKFVDRLMKPYSKAIEKEVGEVTEKLAKQVTQSALRPTSVKKTEKNAAEKSIAELERELGIVNS